jgi:hypothetical protein
MVAFYRSNRTAESLFHGLRTWRILEHVFTFQGQLETVGDARHVMTSASPPKNVESAFEAEVIDKPSHVFIADLPGRLRLFTRK